MSIKYLDDRAKAAVVRSITDRIRVPFLPEAEPIEEDENGAPGGTSDYDGRALAFIITDAGGRQYRILVEEITLDEAVEELLVYVTVHDADPDVEATIYSLTGNDAVEWQAEAKRYADDPDTVRCIISRPDGYVLHDSAPE